MTDKYAGYVKLQQYETENEDHAVFHREGDSGIAVIAPHGGGIEPDVEVKKPELTMSTRALMNSDAIFNFATDYYYRNPKIAAPEAFVLQEEDFEDFLTFLKEGRSNYQTKSEKKFDVAFDLAEEENLSAGIDGAYQALLVKLEAEKMNELAKNKSRIVEMMSDEIINRYYFEKGEYQNHIAFSPFIQEAIRILQDDKAYQSILKNE